jgi:glycosyltransferase involved in cell wall biosynthesis
MSESFTLILPCYNEGSTFEKSVNKIIAELNRSKRGWEIIFVEDKSADDTKLAVERFVKTNRNVRAIFHKKNMGRGKSVADGIIASRFPICGFMDVDCEVSPSYIPLFINEIKRGSDLVVGTRFYEKGFSSISRVAASRVYSFIVKMVLDIPIGDTETGFKFFNKNNILKVLKTVRDEGWFWDTEICARSYWKGLKVAEVPVLFVRRREKKSTVNLVSDSVDYFIKLVKFRSQKPPLA